MEVFDRGGDIYGGLTDRGRGAELYAIVETNDKSVDRDATAG